MGMYNVLFFVCIFLMIVILTYVMSVLGYVCRSDFQYVIAQLSLYLIDKHIIIYYMIYNYLTMLIFITKI